MIEPSDLLAVGLSDQERHEYRTDLEVRIKDRVTLEVKSERGTDWYPVLHDGSFPLQCRCRYATFHQGQCIKHFARIRLVLRRMDDRLQAQQKERRREAMPLNGNQGFTLERR
jgi:hypothetical protein